ncbi:histone h4 [Vairimorpha ceranae]|uniref:Histone H4 n=1 Tax=Vairimorpha ceranae TaxID=40302 RepID=A0A0F9WDZ7_9MICR|nr:histone h4 [Vairimorpha ceranae]KAF5140464.1 hypothetical protein G9O61_00g012690 [Vairimorpha ceranae]KKO75636.1 histone h4 [Vairimorpha ceranae]
MSTQGRGKGSKSAKGIAKKHRKIASNEESISKPAIRRLARRAGVSRVGSGCFNEIRVAAKSYMTGIISYSFVYANHAKRKTITCSDVLYSLKKMGVKYMGY